MADAQRLKVEEMRRKSAGSDVLVAEQDRREVRQEKKNEGRKGAILPRCHRVGRRERTQTHILRAAENRREKEKERTSSPLHQEARQEEVLEESRYIVICGEEVLVCVIVGQTAVALGLVVLVFIPLCPLKL
jgi:hypothetical protein